MGQEIVFLLCVTHFSWWEMPQTYPEISGILDISKNSSLFCVFDLPKHKLIEHNLTEVSHNYFRLVWHFLINFIKILVSVFSLTGLGGVEFWGIETLMWGDSAKPLYILTHHFSSRMRGTSAVKPIIMTSHHVFIFFCFNHYFTKICSVPSFSAPFSIQSIPSHFSVVIIFGVGWEILQIDLYFKQILTIVCVWMWKHVSSLILG